MRVVPITRLKATLSEHLRVVKGGEEVVVTDRGRPVARMIPVGPQELAPDELLLRLEEAGLVRRGEGHLGEEFWSQTRPADPNGELRSSLYGERE